MSAIGDPGAWMVVALVACIHLTYVLAPRFHGTKRWAALLWLAPAGFVVLTYIDADLYDLRYSTLAFVVFTGCGALLSFRIPRGSDAFAAGLVGLALAVVASIWNSSVGSGPQYIGAKAGWESYYLGNGPDGVRESLSSLAIDSGKPTGIAIKTAGFLDEDRFGWTGTGFRGPFTFYSGEPVWHTAVTGLRLRHPHYYRLWIPAGPIDIAAKNAHLVEIPKPPEMDEHGL